MERKRLLLFTNLFPTPTEPQRGIFIFQLARALQCHFDITVVCPLPWFPKSKLLGRFRNWHAFANVPSVYEWKGIDVRSPKYPMIPRVSRSMQSKLMFLSVRRTIKHIHAERSFDVVNSHWLYPDSVAAQKIATSLRIPHVPVGRGCDVNDFLNHPRRRQQILNMLSASDHVVMVSQQLRDRVIEEGIQPDMVTAVTNGVDTSVFYPQDRQAARRVVNIAPRGRYVLYIGRLSAEKAVDVLIDAFAETARTQLDVKLLIAGAGPEYQSLVARVSAHGIDDRVQFVGKVKHSAVPFWINASSFLCLPSYREGCPNVVLESLACGVPVVGSRVGAVPDFVTEECGLLVPPGDAGRLAAALTTALSTTWDRKRIQQKVVTNTWAERAKLYVKVFGAVLSKRAQTSEGLTALSARR